MLSSIFFYTFILMKWYEILIAIPIILIGVYIGIKLKEFRKDMYHNDSWRNRKK